MVTRYSDVFVWDEELDQFKRAPDNIKGTIWYASEHCELHETDTVIYQFFGGSSATDLNRTVKKIT